MDHVALVGMMGVGKSSLARKAARLGRALFRDSDAVVSQRMSKPIADIFAEDGEEAFREMEHKVLSDLLEHHEPTIISTGGGAVLREDNRLLLNHRATVVWLQGDISAIARRLANSPNPRPLVPRGDVSEMEATLSRLLAERRHLYEAVADIALDVSEIGQAAAVEAVAGAIRDTGSEH